MVHARKRYRNKMLPIRKMIMKHKIAFVCVLLLSFCVGCYTIDRENELLSFDIDFDHIPPVYIDVASSLGTDSFISFILDHELDIKNGIDSTQIKIPLEVCISFAKANPFIIENNVKYEENNEEDVFINRIYTNAKANITAKGLINHQKEFYTKGVLIGEDNCPEPFSLQFKPQHFDIQSYNETSLYQLKGSILLNVFDDKSRMLQEIIIPVHRLVSVISGECTNACEHSRRQEKLTVNLTPAETNLQLSETDSTLFFKKKFILQLGALNQDLFSNIENAIVEVPFVYSFKKKETHKYIINFIENKQDSFISAKVRSENDTLFYKIKIKTINARITLQSTDNLSQCYLFSATSIIYIYNTNEDLIGYIVLPVFDRLYL